MKRGLRSLLPALLVSLALGLGFGCTNQNVQLNDARVPSEQRAKNQTLAATGVNVTSSRMMSTTAPIVTTAPSQSSRRYSTTDPRDDGCFVGISLSGGGSRSANFSAACMFQLQRLGVLQRVDYISSVSGGSLTGAYYCLFADDQWNPDTVERKLTHSFASDVIIQALLPWNWFALAFTDYDRSDMLASSFTQNLFRRNGRALTFSDLRPDRPRLLINATDLQSTRPFVFCDESFDELNSDLSRFPISYAVAASAAVPVVLHQVTLRDYSTIYRQYRHLVDGGINDNLGINTLVETFEAQSASAIQAGLPDPYPNGAVIIAVDARTQFDAHLDDKGDIGVFAGVAADASLTTTALLNRVSSATLAELIVRYSPDEVTARDLRKQIDVLNSEGFIRMRDRLGHHVTVVHLPLSRVGELSNLPSKSFFQRLNDIATYFNITEIEAASLYTAADLLMKEKYETRLKEVAAELNGYRDASQAGSAGGAR